MLSLLMWVKSCVKGTKSDEINACLSHRTCGLKLHP